MFLLIFICNIFTIYGISPSFVRQEVDDGIDDLVRNAPLNQTEIRKCNISNVPTVNMKAVSYESNGTKLNTTVWFPMKFNN